MWAFSVSYTFVSWLALLAYSLHTKANSLDCLHILCILKLIAWTPSQLVDSLLICQDVQYVGRQYHYSFCLSTFQAMVTGYSIPRRSQPPPTRTPITNGVTHSNEELQYDSTTTAGDTTQGSSASKLQTRPSSAPNRRSPSPPTTVYRPQENGTLGESHQQPPSAVGYSATNTIPNGHVTPGEVQLQSGLSSMASSHYNGDYTSYTRYPNRSGILVRPLHNDDLSILQQEGVFSGGSTNPPKFYDATPLLPTKTTPPSFSPPMSPAGMCTHTLLILASL